MSVSPTHRLLPFTCPPKPPDDLLETSTRDGQNHPNMPNNTSRTELLKDTPTAAPEPSAAKLIKPTEVQSTQMDVDHGPSSFRATLCPTPTLVIEELWSSICYLPLPTMQSRRLPSQSLKESLLEENRKTLQHTLIGQFLQRQIPTKVLAQSLPSEWRLQRGLDILELPKGFILFAFTTLSDLYKREKVPHG